jgi:hypothetical protein
MGTIPTTTEVNINDLRACVYAIIDGNPEIAQEILEENIEKYEEELEAYVESE